MTITAFLLLLLVAGICGAIGQAIVGYSRAGLFGSVAIGFVGALLGMWLARVLGLPEWFAVRIENQSFPIVWSIAGSALFVALLSLLSPWRTRRVYY